MTLADVAAKMPKRAPKNECKADPRPIIGYGITQQALSQILSSGATIEKLEDIADILGISLSELVATDETIPAPTIICPQCGAVIELHPSVVS